MNRALRKGEITKTSVVDRNNVYSDIDKVEFCKVIGCSMMDDNCPGNPNCDIVKRWLNE